MFKEVISHIRSIKFIYCVTLCVSIIFIVMTIMCVLQNNRIYNLSTQLSNSTFKLDSLRKDNNNWKLKYDELYAASEYAQYIMKKSPIEGRWYIDERDKKQYHEYLTILSSCDFAFKDLKRIKYWYNRTGGTYHYNEIMGKEALSTHLDVYDFAVRLFSIDMKNMEMSDSLICVKLEKLTNQLGDLKKINTNLDDDIIILVNNLYIDSDKIPIQKGSTNFAKNESVLQGKISYKRLSFSRDVIANREIERFVDLDIFNIL